MPNPSFSVQLCGLTENNPRPLKTVSGLSLCSVGPHRHWRFASGVLTLASGGWGLQLPMRFFLKQPPNSWSDHAKILHSFWGFVCATFGKKRLSELGQVTELWHRKWYSLRPIFEGNRVFSHETCYNWLERDITHDLGQNMTTSDLWHCISTFQRPSEVTDLG